MKIDLVVPYVNMDDENWKKLAKENKIFIDVNRFRGQGEFFRYFFRGIEKNLPWINNIFLLVQSESQIPCWLNKNKVKVILHEQFIPSEFLPVFSSCTIEMFLQNIPGLSEHFLYFNDDMYVLRNLSPEDFFKGNLVCQTFITGNETNMCGDINQNGFKLIYNNEFKFKPDHGVRALLLSKCKECYNKYKKEIISSITKTRCKKNMNVYIYSYYLKKNNLCINSNIKLELTFLYPSFKSDIICINDNYRMDIYSDKYLNRKFKSFFTNKSKYEL